jgi:hypothetical protein
LCIEEVFRHASTSREESDSQFPFQPLSEVPKADSQASKALPHLSSGAEGLILFTFRET